MEKEGKNENSRLVCPERIPVCFKNHNISVNELPDYEEMSTVVYLGFILLS